MYMMYAQQIFKFENVLLTKNCNLKLAKILNIYTLILGQIFAVYYNNVLLQRMRFI